MRRLVEEVKGKKPVERVILGLVIASILASLALILGPELMSLLGR